MSADNNKQPGGFEKLMGELETMTKALPAADVADDKKIAAAAGEAGAAADDENKEQLGEDGKPLTKSLQVTLADGTVVDAEDGTELVKSLMARLDSQEDQVVKALGGTIDLVKALHEQVSASNALVKSLQADVARLAGQGAGRKTMVTVHEKLAGTTLAKSEQQGPTAEEFMAKSHAAFVAHKISGQELTSIDVSMRLGQPVDQSLVAKVLG